MKVKDREPVQNHFQSGIGTTMQLQIEAFQNRMTTSLVGVLSDQYLILRLPQLGTFVGQPKHLELESEILVRYLHQGAVWGFKSTVKRVISTPVGLLLIDFPEKVESFDLRREERIECLLPGKAKIGKSAANGIIVDLSKKGCCFVIEIREKKKVPRIEVSEEIGLSFSLPGIAGEQPVTALARHIHQDCRRMSLGLEFVNLDRKMASSIEKYLRSVILA